MHLFERPNPISPDPTNKDNTSFEECRIVTHSFLVRMQNVIVAVSYKPVGVLTTLTPWLALHPVHINAMTSPRLQVPGLLEVNICPDWNVGRLCHFR